MTRLRRLLARLLPLALLSLAAPSAFAQGGTYWVATDGSDTSGDGSSANPWATITKAVDTVPDQALVLVRPGTYNGRVNLRQTFAQGITVRAETPYQARLRHTQTVVTCYECQGVTLEGFDIAHSGAGAGALVIQIQDLIGPPDHTSRVVLRDNVIHDSWNNDLVKINNGARDVLVEGNLFYNQSGSDEHIDVNSVDGVTVRGNVFFNDFAGSGRTNGNDTSSYVVIKDSNGSDDDLLGARNVVVSGNVFLHWEGSTGSSFVLIGEDGQPFHEAFDVVVENNLMLGDSANVMRVPFGIKGSRDVIFRHNTVVGDLPALAYAMRLNREGSNLQVEDASFFGNVWSDPTGTLGSTGAGNPNDFSDTPPADLLSFTLRRNHYWNGPNPLPFDAAERINTTDDTEGQVGNPQLPAATAIVPPRWNPASGLFADGSVRIAQVLEKLVLERGTPGAGSPLFAAGDPAVAPATDILGRPRSANPTLGAVELGFLFADGFETGNTGAWSATVP
ncbi:MAG TPA: DUF1565 domain-containing protein [Thermoanaerobaculia bacterium]|nr:DUF1565 domain-containing protein [Thermoanaerobaculia bacterium]